MKEIDEIAQGVADMTKEIMYDSVEWQIADQPVNGDDFNDLHSYVMVKQLSFFTNKIRHLSDNNIK
jgi:hypothetical protein